MNLKPVLSLLLFSLLVVGVCAKDRYVCLDSANPVTLYGDRIKYNGKTVRLNKRTIYVDGNLPEDIAAKYPYVFRDFTDAMANIVDGTVDEPMRVYIAPYVYWVNNPSVPAVMIGEKGREPFGMVVKCENLHLIGLTDDARKVVLASQRGQTQGAVGNFTMFDFWGDGLQVSNLTMGNYCNVDLDYTLNPRLNIKKRSAAITQAHVAYCHGDRVVAYNVHFISRLNMNPLNGARRILFDSCHMECTDDALTGNGVYLNCTFGFYGQKPFYTTHRCGAVFLDCDFTMESQNAVMAFCKASGPLTVVNSRYHANDNTCIAWANYPDDYMRSYQSGFTLNGSDYMIGNASPANTIDISDKPLLEAYVTENDGKNIYNVWNLLRGNDGWLPEISDLIAGSRRYDTRGQDMPTALLVNRTVVELRTGDEVVSLKATPMRHAGFEWDGAHKAIHWRVVPAESAGLLRMSATEGDSVMIESANNGEEKVTFCVEAYTDDGLVAATRVMVKPALLAQPDFIQMPSIKNTDDGTLYLDYSLQLDGRQDMSDITWFRGDTDDIGEAIPVAVSRDGVSERYYPLTAADNNKYIFACISPRHGRSRDDGKNAMAVIHLGKVAGRQTVLDTDFRTLPTVTQRRIMPGYWTVGGCKPLDTAEYDWTFDDTYDMWVYGEGYNGAIGKGLLQAQRGARLMYQPVEADAGEVFGDMSLVLDVDPTKTAGQGFGSATGQYLDVCIKFDPNTLTGYALRVIRTVKHAKAVDFLLVRYDNGTVIPLTEPISAICYRTGCKIKLDIHGGKFMAEVLTSTPLPDDSSLAKEVHLSADVEMNPFGGVAIQHTGSCGESTTMLHHLHVEW